jgi:hypothetical protein
MTTPAIQRTLSAALSIRALAALAIALALAAGTHVGIAGAHEDDGTRAVQAAYTVTFVEQAIDRYEQNGLGETLAHYNSEESIDGQWYVFIFDARDVLVAHAADPSIVGLHASNVLGPNDYPSGDSVVTVARANPEGAWLDYTYPNPATGDLETKHSWVVVHDGLVFGSGWYEPGPSRSQPAAFTQAVVAQAVNLYEAIGREGAVSYYNSPESVDGQWYMFILDENDIMLAHAANPALVGRPASFADGPNNYPAGEAVVAVADEDGEWFSYSFTNPVSGAAETKHSWMVAHDGLTFGSGWYERGPRKSDAPAYTQDFVGRAINLYDAIGREGTVEYYSTKESVDGQWYVFIVDADGYTIAHHNPAIIGRDPSLRVDSTGYFYGDDLLSATESGKWVDYVLLNPETGDERQKHTWAVLHDGLIFASGWYE